jgi:hypothetical protein
MGNAAEITLHAKSPTLFLNMTMMVDYYYYYYYYNNNPGATVLLKQSNTLEQFVLLNLYDAISKVSHGSQACCS